MTEGIAPDRAVGAAALRSGQMCRPQFELLIAAAFRAQRYSVAENVVGGADGNVDLELRKDGRTLFVQCKQWRTRMWASRLSATAYSGCDGVHGFQRMANADSSVIVNVFRRSLEW